MINIYEIKLVTEVKITNFLTFEALFFKLINDIEYAQ